MTKLSICWEPGPYSEGNSRFLRRIRRGGVAYPTGDVHGRRRVRSTHAPDEGYRTLSAISDRSSTGVRIILTGYSSDGEVQGALADGLIDEVMEKPLQVLSLTERIRKHNSEIG